MSDASGSDRSLTGLAGGGGISANVTSSSLSELATSKNISVSDQIALSEATMRRNVAYSLVAAFVIVNGLVLAGIGWVFNCDLTLLTRTSPAITAKDRLVTTELLMTMIGATTVQLGVFVVLIGKYLFPTPKP